MRITHKENDFAEVKTPIKNALPKYRSVLNREWHWEIPDRGVFRNYDAR